MRRGIWHQCGNRSQKLVEEQLSLGIGVGAIISPRDVSLSKVNDYSSRYRSHGADVLLDSQFYNPQFQNPILESYQLNSFRNSFTQLHQISTQELSAFSTALEHDNQAAHVSGILAPAVIYEAGRPEIIDLNVRLFHASRRVGDVLGLPTIASVVIGESLTGSEGTLASMLSDVTALNPDGWYYSFEFPNERIPSDTTLVHRCCSAGLTLACTGKPVLHGFAGPMALLSFGFGAAAAAVGHSQNLWKFTRGRWESASGQGGGGDAPPRVFSSSLWGTIVYPDESSQLSIGLRNRVLSLSPFAPTGGAAYSKWQSNKHFLHSVCTAVTAAAQSGSARECAEAARALLTTAVALHQEIIDEHIVLKDNTSAYQANWNQAVERLLSQQADDFDFLELL